MVSNFCIVFMCGVFPPRIVSRSNKCMLFFSSAILAEPSRMCSGYYDGPNLIGIYIQELDVYDYPRPDGYICPSGLVCRQVPGTNPSYGFLNMDNLYFSLLNLFTVMSLEGWSDMMYDAQDGESTTAAAFFTFAIYILSFIMIPLFIGKYLKRASVVGSCKH